MGKRNVTGIHNAKSGVLRPLLTFFCAVSLFVFSSTPVIAKTAEERIEENRALPVESNEIINWPAGPVVSAASAILIEANTGAVLYAKNVHAQQYPASTTKILTCLIAAEECDLSEVVTFSHDAVFDTPRDSNNIAIDEREQLTVEECLEAILIRSANECAFAVAEHISGSDWESFAEIMNNRAKELGCVDSNFVNPNGLPDENHYTSAYDLAQIGRAFFANEHLCEITTSKVLHLYPTEHQKDEIIENNANQLLPGKPYEYPYLVGTKTGYTDAARSCLVTCAEKDGMRLICVVMRDEAPNQYVDTIALFDYGFSNFCKVNVSSAETKYNIASGSTFYSNNDIFGSSQPILALNAEDYVILPRTLTFSALTSTISYDTEDPGQAAKITYTYKGQYLGSASVDFAASAEESYEFESPPLSTELQQEEAPAKEEKKIVFVNVVKIALYVLAGLAFIGFLFLVVRFFQTHHFRPRPRSQWKRERRHRTSVNFHREARRSRRNLQIANRRRRQGRDRLRRRTDRGGPTF